MSAEREVNIQPASPVLPELAEALWGVSLPQKKEGLRMRAEFNGAERNILSIIEGLPEREYKTVADIMSGAEEAIAARGGG